MNGLDRHITGNYGEDMFRYEEDPDVEPIVDFDEDAITTEDFVNFYLYGNVAFTLDPDVYFVSDHGVYFVSDHHGNWHRLGLSYS